MMWRRRRATIRGRVRMRVLAGLFLVATALAGVSETWAARIALEPVLANLEGPLYLTPAGDGSNRLFVVERSGRIKVLLPGAAEPRLFLDIVPRVLSGGERGLLGLAFHPRYAATGRFFVNYTREPDGATVIAEYRVSPNDPNLSQGEERPLLVIGQPFANHNGGMLAFGPDGFLYIGMGDGGAGFDPDRRAQNPSDLLGKILRIDVDPPPGATVPYLSPADNPFRGRGRDEVFAIGLRNPWRFSFDRVTGALVVGDVGQGEREEIDLVTGGGNYGWPILEGGLCLGLGDLPCTDPALVPPLAEYDHAGGRCSVTGGYAYRGNRGTLPAGAYVFGDFCSGEIFLLEQVRVSLLLATPLSLSSFGEDEAGEIYVVDLGGTLHRLVNLDAPTLALHVNQPVLRAGDTLRVGVEVHTGEEPIAADGYFGVVQPDGQTVAFVATAAPPTGIFTTLGADARTFPPVAPGQTIPAGAATRLEDFFVYTVGTAEPAGTYVIFAALVRPGALSDGRVDGGDLLALAIQTVAVARMAP